MTMRVDFGTGCAGLENQRQHTRDVCDIEPLTPVDAFHADCEIAKVGSTLFILTRTTSVAYIRGPVHVVRGGDDHYQIQFQLDGLLRGRSSTLGAGDVGVHDMSHPSVTEIHAPPPDPQSHARVLTWMVPRMLLVPLIADPNAVHGLRLAASAPYVRLLCDVLWSVWTNAARCAEHEGETAAYSLLLLLAGGLGQSEEADEAVSRAVRAVRLDAIKRYVETQLEADEIRVNDIARRFGLSRASLYRRFEPDGGFASYVRSRRLHRAARLLSSPTHRHLRILDVALESRFASEASFARAFRREFGLSPAELRASIDAHGIVRPAAVEPFDWLRRAGARPPHAAAPGAGDGAKGSPP
jgi:AraC-like DNA-binding protein